MILLSLTCGRNASATLLKDGRVLVHVLRERVTRQRHALGLCQRTVARAFEATGLKPEMVDACILTGDHGEPLLIEEGAFFALDCADSPIFRPSGAHQEDGKTWLSIAWKAPRLAPPSWEEETRLETLKAYATRHFPDMAERRLIMDVPVKTVLAGRQVPGIFVDHHAAHAAASYYASPFDKAVVVTHDSGEGMDSGFLFYGHGSYLFPIAPHDLELGELYNDAAARVGLKGYGGSGKLMGLSAYGKPLPGLASLAGTIHDWRRRFGEGKSDSEIRAALLTFLCDAVASRGISLVGLGDAGCLPFPGASDFAASVQGLFNESFTQTCIQTAQALAEANLDARNLCLGGGAALNCPTNTRLATESGFENVFIAPHTENGGLSIGAAWWYLHNVLNQPRYPEHAAGSRYAMMGATQTEAEILGALKKRPDLIFQKSADPVKDAAHDLASGLFVGWFEGESEIGPRALGHRSLLADPRGKDVATRMNAIKGREKWRPFAPVCAAESLKDWFEGGPEASPFMLFTYKIKKDKEGQLPAITHVDGTSRAQTVTREDGRLYELLKAFEKETGVPVLLNTSFNGAGEPIVETPEDALRFFLSGKLDVLYLGDYRLTK